MDYTSPAFIEWIILNSILIVLCLFLVGKYCQEKRKMNVQALLT